MASLERVPCVNVTTVNFERLWPKIKDGIGKSVFIALDLELSGIGGREVFKIKEIDERYRAFAEIASTRSIVSIGVSLFQRNAETEKHMELSTSPSIEDNGDFVETPDQYAFVVENYDFLCKCQDAYKLDEDAKRFLNVHGFSFDKHSSLGLPYHRGNDKEIPEFSIRALLDQIIKLNKPIVFHNGFVDLIFLYQNFYCDLPGDFQDFVRDLSDMFPSIYDTKFISEDGVFRSSFLEFVFYERQRRNLYRMMKRQAHATINFEEHFDPNDVEFRNLKTNVLEELPEGMEICGHYGFHGWCERGIQCDKSHNIDFVLDKAKMTSRKNGKRSTRSRKLEKLSRFTATLKLTAADPAMPIDGSGDTVITSAMTMSSELGRCKSAAHRSGYDAFMTGYAFVGYMISNNVILLNGCLNKRDAQTAKMVNNVFLSGKEQPLRIRATNFSKTSKNHKEKIEKLRAAQL